MAEPKTSQQRTSRWVRFRSPPLHAAHRRHDPKSPLTGRALRAAALIVCGLTAIAVGSFVSRGADASSEANGAAREGLELSQTIDAVVAGEDAVAADDAIPAWFEEEFFSPATFFDIRCNAEQTVVSLLASEPARPTLEACIGAMERRGWTALATGRDLMKTMVRAEGSHTWAMLWAVDVGGQCSIVVQTLPGR